MCSILFTDKKIKDFDDVNFHLRFRGPDKTEIVEDETNGYTFIHNLLSITGEFTPQPFIEDGVVFLFNGEIYNFKDFGDYKSDGHCIIDLYKKYGVDFVKRIDGEFAVFLLDLNKDLAIMHCVGEYPTPVESSNMNRITEMREAFPDIKEIEDVTDHIAGTNPYY